MQEIYRQGDVIIVRLPEDLEVAGIPTRSNVLAYGEATGHSHKFMSGVEVLAPYDSIALTLNDAESETFAKEDYKYLRVLERAVELLHEEHGTTVIPAGNYAVLIQRTYEPDRSVNVQD
jgi:hypothetical protein